MLLPQTFYHTILVEAASAVSERDGTLQCKKWAAFFMGERARRGREARANDVEEEGERRE